MGHRYQIYGAQIDSTRPLRGLLAGRDDVASDLRLEWYLEAPDASLAWVRLPALERGGQAEMSLWRTEAGDGERFSLRCEIDGSACEFILHRRQRVLQIIRPKVLPLGRLRSHLFGSVMSSVLRLQGTLCVHGSAVGVEGRAVVILGRKTAGKSTTAAALMARGATVLSDDIAAMTASAVGFDVHPGPMHLRLSRPDAHAFSRPGADIPLGRGENPKIRLRLGEPDQPDSTFSSHSLPLACIILLQQADDLASPCMSALAPRQGLWELSRHLYGFCLDREVTWPREFGELSRLAAAVPLHRLRRPHDLGQMSALCDMILASARERGRSEQLG